MNLGRMLAREMAGSGNMTLVGDVTGNVNPYIEWIKWLEYQPEFLKLRIQELTNKGIETLSIDEIQEIKYYKYLERILKLFKIYGTKEITKDEYMEVYDYMVNNKIEDLMLSKLTKEELIRAKEKIEYYRQIPHKELREKVRFEKEKDNYKKLSMVDSYIIHMLCKIDSFRNITKLNSDIDEQIRRNDSMRNKSLYRALNPYKK